MTNVEYLVMLVEAMHNQKIVAIESIDELFEAAKILKIKDVDYIIDLEVAYHYHYSDEVDKKVYELLYPILQGFFFLIKAKSTNDWENKIWDDIADEQEQLVLFQD